MSDKVEEKKTPYAVLGVPEDCRDDKVIKKAYRQLALKYHPDRVPEEEKKQAEEIMQKINDAYSLIKDEPSRQAYEAEQQVRMQQMNACVEIPVYVVDQVLHFENEDDKKKLWKDLLFKNGSSLRQKFALFKPFEDCKVYPGKFRILSQNLFVDMQMSISGIPEPVKARREFIYNQTLVPQIANFPGCPPEIFQLAVQEIMDWTQSFDFEKSTLGEPKSTVDIDENELANKDSYVMERELSTHIKKMTFELLRKTLKEVKENEKQKQNDGIISEEELDLSDPQINMGVCASHPASKDKGSIVMEFPALIIDYQFKGRRYIAIANMATGKCFGETEPGFFQRKLIELIEKNLQETDEFDFE